MLHSSSSLAVVSSQLLDNLDAVLLGNTNRTQFLTLVHIYMDFTHFDCIDLVSLLVSFL